MATSKTEKAEKPAATKKAAAPKAKPAAKAAKPAAPKAVKPKKEAPARQVDGKIKVTQVVGTIGRQKDQRATLVGLGLNKRHRSRILENSPEVRGMVYKVRHLVTVEKVS